MIVIMTIMSFIQIKKHKFNDTDTIVMCTERKMQQKKKIFRGNSKAKISIVCDLTRVRFEKVVCRAYENLAFRLKIQLPTI